MDIDSVVAEFKTMLYGQLRLAGEDPSVEAAGEAILSALEPALKQAASTLAEQAAVEVGSQLPDHAVDVVLASGQPTLVVRPTSDVITVNTDDLGARITVRLPEELKDDLEIAASDLGDSVNTFVVRALAGNAKRSKASSRSVFKGTIDT
jgi:uncharacterized protein (DUF1778 family)